MRTAIVVPGSGARGWDGVYRITRACRRLVREAERLALAYPVDLVVFSGWSPRGGVSEAEQMQAEWAGAEVELLAEPTASLTVENAARTLPLLLERGIERALVVCAPLHVYRARFFFSSLYGRHGIETEFHVARLVPGPRAIVWELVAMPVRRRHLRSAEAELAARAVRD